MSAAIVDPADDLTERVRVLATERAAWPSGRAVMRECRVGAPRAQAALAALRAEGFDPTPAPALTIVPDAPETQAHPPPDRPGLAAPHPDTDAPAEDAEAATRAADIAVDGLAATRRVPRWPLLIIAAGAFVSIWSGWVGLGKLTGFGPVVLLPGIADGWVINSAITLPLGVEAYAAFAMWAWLSDTAVSARARTFARRSALGALSLGAAGQIAYHLMAAAGVERAPWPITAFVACLPVVVLGCGAALAHLLHTGEA